MGRVKEGNVTCHGQVVYQITRYWQTVVADVKLQTNHKFKLIRQIRNCAYVACMEQNGLIFAS